MLRKAGENVVAVITHLLESDNLYLSIYLSLSLSLSLLPLTIL